MKRLLLLMLLAILLVGCSQGVSETDYNNLKDEKAEIERDLEEISGQKVTLETNYNNLITEKNNLQTEYDSLVEQMKPYEAMTQAEVEARTAEENLKKYEAEEALKKKEEQKKQAEQEKAKKEKEEKVKKAEKAKKEKAEKAKKSYNTGITYDQLARKPKKYEGEKIKFTGKVLQVLEGDEEIHIRLAVNSNYDTVIYCAYDPSIVSSRILENDKITVYGTSLGLYSYESSITTITIPAMYVDKIDG